MKRGALLGMVLVLGVAPALAAQEIGLAAFGLRSGFSLNPDQFHFGVFADAGRLLEQVRFQPSFEFGLGNGVRLGAANADALYVFAPRRFRPYAGGGVGVNFIDVTSGVGEGRGIEIEAVLNAVGGVEWGAPRAKGRMRRYLLEARLGFGDTPDFKLTAGFLF